MLFLSPPRRIALLGLISLALAVGIGRFGFTPLLPVMQTDGLINIPQGGIIASAHFIGYLIGALTIARITFAPRLLFSASLIAIGCGTIGMGLTDNVVVWLILRWLNGILSAWVLVLVSSYFTSRLADTGRADLQGWVFSGVGAGIAIAGLTCITFMISGAGSALGWRIIGIASTLCAGATGLAPVTNFRPKVRRGTTSRRIVHRWTGGS